VTVFIEEIYNRVLVPLLMCLLMAACSGNGSEASKPAPTHPECIAPSRPGGGFDLTCKLAQKGFMESKLLPKPMRVSYQPGGIGAVAYNTIVTQRADDNNLIVAFSGGSLLNLAQGKFGRYTENDVRWIAAIGSDYGMLAVRQDSPYHNLDDLVAALKKDPTAVVFGAGGTVGSQDWMKSVLIAREAGVDYRAMRYVAFEGGGEAQTALLGGHIQAYSGDISEVQGMLESGRIRVLAVLADQRLPAPYDKVPTAREQGYDVTWPIIRGFYTGPQVSDAAYHWWLQRFDKLMADPRFAKLRHQLGMFPYDKTGADLDAVIKERMAHYRRLVRDFGLGGQTTQDGTR
jgi:putative tricarboxylic transport membrane protein